MRLCWFIDARICGQSTWTFTASQTKNTTIFPHKCTVPSYSRKIQMELAHDKSALLDNKITKCIQSIVSNFLYYAQLVEPKMLRSIIGILRMQSKPTKDTNQICSMILYYLCTYLNEVIQYNTSDMVSFCWLWRNLSHHARGP